MSLNPIFFNFKGTTNIYTITDTHQDTRKTRTVLSEVVNKAKKQKNVLLLNCGDMFKGIYPRELEADSFVKAKELAPELEIVTTLGNNDLGFNEQHLKYLISTIKKIFGKWNKKRFVQISLTKIQVNVLSGLVLMLLWKEMETKILLQVFVLII